MRTTSRWTLAATAVALLVLSVPQARASASVVHVYPSPGTRVASRRTQLSFRGVAPGALGAVSVVGSVTGAHAGRVEAHSDGQGASFVPDAEFAPGETVTVHTALDVEGAAGGTFAIGIATPGPALHPPARQPPLRLTGAGLVRPHSRHDLVAPLVHASAPHGRTAPGDLFLGVFDAPGELGPGQHGPMITDAAGGLVWFHPLPAGDTALDVREQQYGGQPVLTWWQGFVNAGVGDGVGEIFDTSYRRIATVSAGDGYAADPHELQLTPRGTALVVVTNPVVWDLSGIGGARRAVVLDDVVQEIDVKTGLVLYEWHSLDHVAVRDSYVPPRRVDGHVDDYFHVNSVSETPDGNLLVSGRNTWTVYKLARADGRVLWRLGGKRSSFAMGAGAGFAWQHDARVAADGTITLFDDGAAPAVHRASRAIAVGIDTKRHRAWLSREYRHGGPSLLADSQGSMQDLAGGDVLVGWGSERYATEYSRHGALVRDYRFPAGAESYRAYRFPWSARPLTQPAIAASTDAHGRTRVYASWNGATGVARWELLAGPSASALRPVASVARSGFETAASIAGAPFVAVQARDAHGAVLATSP
ncbi:MAG TPA: arylsulfotransferase family protein, partial [Conexibacter sp.]|nr:arylsulfotransferase family protein [Conexibacter sp.]